MATAVECLEVVGLNENEEVCRLQVTDLKVLPSLIGDVLGSGCTDAILYDVASGYDVELEWFAQEDYVEEFLKACQEEEPAEEEEFSPTPTSDEASAKVDAPKETTPKETTPYRISPVTSENGEEGIRIDSFAYKVIERNYLVSEYTQVEAYREDDDSIRVRSKGTATQKGSGKKKDVYLQYHFSPDGEIGYRSMDFHVAEYQKRAETIMRRAFVRAKEALTS